MIAEIRKATADDRLSIVADQLSHIEEINGYVVQFHHDANPLAGYEIAESELRLYAQKTVDFVHGAVPAT